MLKTIKTKRLVLRPFCANDLYTTHAYASNAENTQYMLYLPHDSLEETSIFLHEAEAEWQKENPSFFKFAIDLNGHHIGAILLYISNDFEGELGWIIHKDFWGNGYVTEAANAIKEFAKHDIGLEKLNARCDSRNTGSNRVMQNIGLVLKNDNGIRFNKGTNEPSKELSYSLEL